MSIKGIIFDFGFTLFYFENPSVERYYECFKKGLLKSIELLKEKQVWNGKISDELFVKKFSKKREQYWRESRKTKTEFPTSLIYREVLESLKEENFVNKIDHLNEDTYEKLAEIYHSFEQKEWKPFPKTSAEFGKRKPDPEIFLYTLEKMGLTENNECMVCGDEYADVVGGDRAGMQTILCERKYKFPFERELEVPNLIRIDNISEILEHLD